jgi:hypothetical protein
MRAFLRAAAATALLTLLILYAPRLLEGSKPVADGDLLDDPIAEARGIAATAKAAAAKDMQAFKTAHEGMACLSGDGPCPHGQPGPFK